MSYALEQARLEYVHLQDKYDEVCEMLEKTERELDGARKNAEMAWDKLDKAMVLLRTREEAFEKAANEARTAWRVEMTTAAERDAARERVKVLEGLLAQKEKPRCHDQD